MLAEFLGCGIKKRNSNGFYHYVPNPTSFEGSLGPVIDWKPNGNPGQCIKVLEKICKIKYEDGDYAYCRTFGMIDKEGQYMVRINRMPVHYGETIGEALYTAVVEFVQEYNEVRGECDWDFYTCGPK